MRFLVSIVLILIGFSDHASGGELWLPAQSPVRAVVLMVHGLNLKPEKMDELGKMLASSGMDVLRIGLSGHGPDPAEFGRVSAEGWVSETLRAYELSSRRAEEAGVPVYFVGFSLGGLLGQELLNCRTSGVARPFERAVLLAPALRARFFAHFIRPFFLLGDSFTLGSANDPGYRAHEGTPMAAYRATFELMARVEKGKFGRANMPTLVLVDPRDEFVNFSGIEAIIKDYRLTNWRVMPVSVEGSTLSRPRHHLIIDESAVGNAEWARMIAAIREHFGL